jgi:hypothetical protein
MAGRGVVPAISQRVHRLEFIARTEEAIGTSEQAITRQLLLIETLAADGRDANPARELLRVAKEHLAELHAKRRQLLEASAG